MKRRLTAAVIAALAILMSGCGQVQEAANDAVDQASARASEAVDDAISSGIAAGKDAVLSQICGPVEDGTVDAADMQILSGLQAAAQEAGVPQQFTEPLEEIVRAGDEIPAKSVAALRQSCADVEP